MSGLEEGVALDLADVFHTEYRRLTAGGRDADEDVRDEAVSESLQAVEMAVRDSIARDFERIGWRPMTLQEIANLIRSGSSL